MEKFPILQSSISIPDALEKALPQFEAWLTNMKIGQNIAKLISDNYNSWDREKYLTSDSQVSVLRNAQ